MKLGRTLEEVYPAGGALFLREMALAVWAQAGRDWRCKHLDTPSWSLTGASVPAPDEHAMGSTHGSSTDHRPDWQPAGLAVLVSQDGGVPLGSPRWDGHTSDPTMFQARAQALMATFQPAPSPRALVADAHLDPEDHAATLPSRGLSTRLPNTRTLVSPVSTDALRGDTGPRVQDTTRSPRVECWHAGMAQRWLVVSAAAAWPRAEAPVSQAQQRDEEAIAKPRVPWQAPRVETPEAADAALGALATAWTSHQVASSSLLAQPREACTGRPTPPTPIQALTWPSTGLLGRMTRSWGTASQPTPALGSGAMWTHTRSALPTSCRPTQGQPRPRGAVGSSTLRGAGCGRGL